MSWFGYRFVVRSAQALALTAALVATTAFAVPPPSLRPGPSEAHLRGELSMVEARVDGSLEATLDDAFAARVALTKARSRLRTSDGRVLRSGGRTALADEISAASARVENVSAAYLEGLRLAARARSTAAHGPAGLETALEELRVIPPVPTPGLRKDPKTLKAGIARVDDDVERWKTEQRRKARERREAREAAERSAARRAAVAATETATPAAADPEPASAAPAGASSPTPRTVRVAVRTSVTVSDAADTARAQQVVNGGGQVAVRYTQVGMTVVSAHNWSDSTALRLSPGERVRFAGALNGLYRVTGALWVGERADVSSLRALGTPVAMQSCGSSSMRVVGLSPIG